MYSLKTIVIISLVACSSAAVIFPRQAGGSSLACNTARFQIVSALGNTDDSVDDIQDPAIAKAAKAGVDQAFTGIGQIAQALLAGQAPPASGRNITAAGLESTAQALAGGDKSDPAVVAAQSSLQEAIKAGQDVVAKC